ncbi:MAG: thiolase family protein [Candidatus Poseidoniales archaeon]|jgi:acetyl-CoA C-acetyltransferase|tara:strand:- start:1103 stop:2263 length:1161 start_codon:yes stop_codon:yes gene_type:complete
MEAVNICAYARTPVGKFRGLLSDYSATDLGAMTIRELLKRVDINPKEDLIDQLYMGQVLQGGAGQAPARQVALGAGMSFGTPCTTINKVCGSSLKAVMIGASDIRAKMANLVIAGGMESMSNAPYFINNPSKESAINFSDLESILSHDGLKDAYSGEMMGNTGETVAIDFGITREQSDSFAVRSHVLANKGWIEGWLKKETFEVNGVFKDEGIRPGTSIGKLRNLRTIFSDVGQVTAGNASQLSDGASAILIASDDAVKKFNLPILAKIIDYTTSGVEPSKVMSAPILAVEILLKRNSLNITDIDLLEHNEAFASASCAVKTTLKVSEDKFNPHGGAVAIGHPLGATGTRCLMTLVNALERTSGRRGIVTICLGGGNAVAMLIERN